MSEVPCTPSKTSCRALCRHATPDRPCPGDEHNRAVGFGRQAASQPISQFVPRRLVQGDYEKPEFGIHSIEKDGISYPVVEREVLRKPFCRLLRFKRFADDAAHMPWADGFFDAVASVYLFHELPPRVRRDVVGEIRRVLKPGGTVVICDSAQLSDSAEIADALSAFPAGYHEPYYKGYLRDDLAALLGEGGFEVVGAEPFLVSKVVIARKAKA